MSTPIFDALATTQGGYWHTRTPLSEREDLTVSHTCPLPDAARPGVSWDCDCGKTWTYRAR